MIAVTIRGLNPPQLSLTQGYAKACGRTTAISDGALTIWTVAEDAKELVSGVIDNLHDEMSGVEVSFKRANEIVASLTQFLVGTETLKVDTLERKITEAGGEVITRTSGDFVRRNCIPFEGNNG